MLENKNVYTDDKKEIWIGGGDVNVKISKTLEKKF